MRNILFFASLFFIFSCDDGDLEIDTIDFDSVDPQTCEATDVDTVIFFKINGDEALILELQTGLLKNEVSATAIESAIGTASKLTYRLFSDDVTNTYFCSDIPVTTPTVLSEIQAANGKVFITTSAVENDTVSFMHNIQLSDVTFQTDTDSRITDLTINDFGTVTTVKTE